MTDIDPTAPGVVASISGRTGWLQLNRPRALNALNAEMIVAISEAMDAWRDDPAVERVLLTSTSERAFCAGGDVRAARAALLEGTDATEMFQVEYPMNLKIGTYPKPFISLIDKVNMGGGLGVSVHGSVRVTTESSMWAMPETAIGFVPDVGMTAVLPHLPFRIGYLMGLTGYRLSGAGAAAVGLATHTATPEQLETIQAELLGGADLDEVLAAHTSAPVAPDAAVLGFDPDAAARVFAGSDPAAIAERLAAEPGEWAEQAREQLAAASPLSVAVTLAVLERGAGLDLAGALEQERVVGGRLLHHQNFAEGIRAVLVDKDRNPSFVPATLAEVTPELLAEFVAP